MPPSRDTLGCYDRCGYGDEPAVLASSNIGRPGLLTLIFACQLSHCFGSSNPKTSRKGIGGSDNLFESSTLHSPKRMDAQIANDKQAPEPTTFLGMLACCRATIIVPLP
ncbi:hypothetical protein GE21DRAFT_1341249 [Neurospora crassa]|nr:hypothetical protein GE21DRAFT_1341249 [Neurospora crassa]